MFPQESERIQKRPGHVFRSCRSAEVGRSHISLRRHCLYGAHHPQSGGGLTQMIKHREDRLPIIEVMIDLAQKLGLRVTVEGIETAEQVEYFQQRGDMLLQGYYFGMPDTDAALLTTPNRSSGDRALLNFLK